MMFEAIIFYLLLVDAVIANFFAFFGGKQWYRAKVGLFARWFPLSKGWTLYYLVLVLWIGVLLHRAGVLFGTAL